MEEIRKNILNVVTTCETAQFCTFALNTYPETRTLANMMNKDKNNIMDLTLFFMTNINSNKIAQIKQNNKVSTYYFNPETHHTMTLFGLAEIIVSQEEKSKFWNDSWKNFGYTGKDDKNYCIIKFMPKIYKFYIGKEQKSGEL